MALRVLSSDLVNPEMVALIVPHNRREEKKVFMPDSYTGLRGPAGAVQLTGIPLPGIMALDMRWQTEEAVTLVDEVPSQAVNINFQLQGHLQSRFSGMPQLLDMQPGRHNLIFAPEPGDENNAGRKADLRMFHISIDRQHFAELLTGGGSNAWADRVLRELEAGRPFSAVPGTATITPAMQALIRGIHNPLPAAGPMGHLLLHARVLELLSLQFGQFVAATGTGGQPAALSLADTERLHGLRAYLDMNFLEENLSLALLSRKFLLNEFKLKRGFRELFGTTVFGYLKSLRMQHANMLLRDGGQLVEEVAYALGYEHAHHFSAAFKKHFGSSPGQWAKQRQPVL